ncbi:MAG: BatD family protein, partial [Candidatus Krumholzibacteriaceae bacterium]
MARSLGILIILMLAAGATAAAEDITVQAYVESETVYMGETFVYQIVVNGADNATPPDLSAFGPDFSVQFLGGQNSSSQSITVINGKMQREVHQGYVMQFNLTPKQKGKLTIPSVPVKVKGQTFNTNPVTIGVDTPVETQDFKVRMTLSRSTCYVGEPVILTVTWYIGRDVEEFSFSMPLLSDGDFGVETPEVKIDQSKRYYQIPVGGRQIVAEKGTGQLDGVYYATISFTKAIIPKRAGTLTIPQTSVECAAVSGAPRGRDLFDDFMNDNFFGARRGAMKKYVIPSNAPVLVVKDVPQEGRP